jgi:outer membrane protein
VSHALDLLEVWQAAQSQDPQVAVSQAAVKAGAARREQSKALWRPSVQLIVGGGVGLSESGSTGAHFAAPGQPASSGVDFNTSVQAGLSGRWVLSARKALNSGERSAQGRQLELSADIADLQMQSDYNALMLQTATRYLDVVLAHKSLALLEHQHQAAQSAWVQAQDRFALGDKAITDTHEARQRAMQLQAQVLEAKSKLRFAQRVLAQSTGLSETQMQANDLQPLAALAQQASAPQLPALEALQAQSQARNIGLRLQLLRVEIAAQEIVKSSATSRSSLDLVANLGQDRIAGDGAYGNASNSATQGSWKDDNDDDKDSYLSTGVLIPTHQPVSEIIVTRHRISGINSLLDAYKAKKKNIQQYCRVFDTKELVTKHDVDSKVWTKLPPKDVRSLAMDALKHATTKLADIEEVKGN